MKGKFLIANLIFLVLTLSVCAQHVPAYFSKIFATTPCVFNTII